MVDVNLNHRSRRQNESSGGLDQLHQDRYSSKNPQKTATVLTLTWGGTQPRDSGLSNIRIPHWKTKAT